MFDNLQTFLSERRNSLWNKFRALRGITLSLTNVPQDPSEALQKGFQEGLKEGYGRGLVDGLSLGLDVGSLPESVSHLEDPNLFS